MLFGEEEEKNDEAQDQEVRNYFGIEEKEEDPAEKKEKEKDEDKKKEGDGDLDKDGKKKKEEKEKKDPGKDGEKDEDKGNKRYEAVRTEHRKVMKEIRELRKKLSGLGLKDEDLTEEALKKRYAAAAKEKDGDDEDGEGDGAGDDGEEKFLTKKELIAMQKKQKKEFDDELEQLESEFEEKNNKSVERERYISDEKERAISDMGDVLKKEGLTIVIDKEAKEEIGDIIEKQGMSGEPYKVVMAAFKEWKEKTVKKQKGSFSQGGKGDDKEEDENDKYVKGYFGQT